MLHLRKAGGTSLRRLLQTHCRRTGIEFEALEGRSTDRDELARAHASSSLVTCLRDPIERIKSSYRFEGRWKQAADVRSPQDAVSFRDWIDRTLATEPSPRLWTCVDNYYVKSLTGYPR